MNSRRVVVTLMVLFIHSILLAQPPVAQFFKDAAKTKTDSAKLKVYKKANDAYKNASNDSLKLLLEQGAQEFESSGYDKGRAQVLLMLSSIYSEEANMAKSKTAIEEALNIFTKQGDKAGIAKCHINIGLMAGMQSKYDEAIRYFLMALKYFEQSDDTVSLIGNYVKLGVVNDYMRNYNKALDYYSKGLALASKIKHTGNTIFLYNNIGTTHARNNNLDTAKVYFEKALEIGSEPQFKRTRVSPLMNIGIIYREQGNRPKAMEYHRQAMTLAKELNMPEDYAQAVYNLGVVESEIDPNNIKSMEEALNIAREIGDKRLEMDILGGLSDWAEDNGRYKEQVAYMIQERALRDSIYNLDKDREIASLQSQYELEKTTDQLEEMKAAQKENAQKRKLIVIAALILAATLLTLLFFFIKTRRLNAELSLHQQELEEANHVKDRLFSIIGHDLKGPIGSIPVLMDIFKDPGTGEEERKFIMESLEENAKASIDTLDKLLNWGKLQIKGSGISQTVCDAAEIMEGKLRLFKVTAGNKNIDIVNNVPAGLKVLADENQFKFILRNLLSNAIKYTNPGGKIEVSAAKHTEANLIVFAVKDNGIGIPKDKQGQIFEPNNTSTAGTANESGTSIGLMLCKEFVRQNGGNIWVESEPGSGSTFYFSVKRA